MNAKIRRVFRKEIEGKYTYRETEDEILIFSADYSYHPVYKIIKSGIGAEERGIPHLIGDFGSLDNNVLAFAVKYGSGNSNKDDRMSRLYREAISSLRSKSKEEIISSLGLSDIVWDYLKNNHDVRIEHHNNELVLIKYWKENNTGTIAIDSNDSWKFYMDVISIVSAKQYIEKLLTDYSLDISPELFIKLVSFSATGLSTSVMQT